MGGTTDTQSLRFGYDGDVISHVTVKELADDIATQFDAADVLRTAALKRPVAQAYRSTALSLPVNTITAVPWTSEANDTHGMIDIATQPTRFTVSASAGAGVYQFHGTMYGLYTGWTRGDLLVYRNGTMYVRKTFATPQDLDDLSITATVDLPTVGDYLTFHLYHEGGGSTDTIGVGGRIHKIANA